MTEINATPAIEIPAIKIDMERLYKYTILSLRENDYYDDAKMKIGNLDVRMPVFKNLAHSSVLMTIAKLVMYEIPIEIDDTYFTNEGEEV